MALKAVVETLEDIPENLQEFYKETGDVWVLGIDGVDDHPSVKNLKSAHERQKKETSSLKAKVAEIEESLGAYGETTPDEIEELRKRLEEGGETKPPSDEELNAIVEKRWETVRARLEKTNEASLKQAEDFKAALEASNKSLAEERIYNKLKDAAVSGSVRKKALGLITKLADDVWRLDENGEPIAMSGDEPINGAHGPIEMAEWVESLRAEHDYLFEPNTGAGAGDSTKPGNFGGVKTISDISNADDLTAIAEGRAVRAA